MYLDRGDQNSCCYNFPLFQNYRPILWVKVNLQSSDPSNQQSNFTHKAIGGIMPTCVKISYQLQITTVRIIIMDCLGPGKTENRFKIPTLRLSNKEVFDGREQKRSHLRFSHFYFVLFFSFPVVARRLRSADLLPLFSVFNVSTIFLFT